MLMFLYHFIWTVALVFMAPVVWLLRLRSGAKGHGSDLGARIHARFTWSHPGLPPKKGAIWVHALSVGEVISALPLIDRLKQEFASRDIIFTATTAAGLAVAREKLDGKVKIVFPMPVDAWWCVRRVVDFVNPSVFILVETDIWPGLLGFLRRKGIRSILVNGRISPRTLRAYKRALFLVRKLFDPLHVCLMQSDLDRNRLLMTGIDKKKVITAGNMKFDRQMVPMNEQERQGWLRVLDLKAEDPLWVAGSTHPGEEEVLLDVFKKLRRSLPRLHLILAPRDVGRSGSIVSMAKEKGIRAVLKTRMMKQGELGNHEGYDVLVLDTMGELGRIYGLGSVCFVGGSLVPIGGHNLLEPSRFGIPVVFGPHTHNFVSMSTALLEAGGGCRVHNGDELHATIKAFLQNGKMRTLTGARARAFIEKNRGAIETVLCYVKDCMAQRE